MIKKNNIILNELDCEFIKMEDNQNDLIFITKKFKINKDLKNFEYLSVIDILIKVKIQFIKTFNNIKKLDKIQLHKFRKYSYLNKLKLLNFQFYEIYYDFKSIFKALMNDDDKNYDKMIEIFNNITNHNSRFLINFKYNKKFICKEEIIEKHYDQKYIVLIVFIYVFLFILGFIIIIIHLNIKYKN